MGYDLHVVRTGDWLDAAKSPIGREEVDRLIGEDPDLDWSDTDFIDMKDEHDVSVRYPLIAWRGSSCFWWYRDQIICKDPDHTQMVKFIRIGQALNEQVVGDDGEKYVLRRGWFGRESVETIQP